MKSLYLILAATAVVVTCKPQLSNNDIIWYPVDDEEGVFISIFGEKHRTTQNPKWRSPRRPRFSGMEPHHSYDPSENLDPSFFHNINERRPFEYNPPILKAPPSFQNHQFPIKRPNKRPQAQRNEILKQSNFQDIITDVFEYNKHPFRSENSGSRPGTTNQWNARPAMEKQRQWGGNPFQGNANQWGGGQRQPSEWGSTSGSLVNRPSGLSNQWGSISGSSANEYPGQRPSTSNQWGSNSGSRPFERPTNEWIITPSNTNRPNRRPNNRPSNKPTNQSDKLIFPDDTSSSTVTTTTTTTTSLGLLPTDKPTRSPCENMCPVTPEFNPVCGTDSVTYSNAGRLKCAQMCGKNVRLSHYGNCGRTPFITPLVSGNPKPKFGGFW